MTFADMAEEFADEFMIDTATITGPVDEGEPSIDETTLEATFPDPTVKYQGPAHLSDRVGQRTNESTGVAEVVDTSELKIPAGEPATRVLVGDLVTVASWPGETFEIVRMPARTNQPTVRFILQRVTGLPGTASA